MTRDIDEKRWVSNVRRLVSDMDVSVYSMGLVLGSVYIRYGKWA